jgi:hypothetical protein
MTRNLNAPDAATGPLARRRGRAAAARRRAAFVLAALMMGGPCLGLAAAGAETPGPAVSFAEDGILAIQGSAVVPRYAADGRWVEVQGKSSPRWATRHFLFTGPDGPPAMELYVSQNLAGERPDGAFEIGLVGGFLSGFGVKSGFRHREPVFEDASLGSNRVKRCRAELSRGDRTLWLYAYVFVRQPSLTFLTLRPRSDASGRIEEYLGSVRLR